MPRITRIEFSIKMSNASCPDNYYSSQGITYREALEDEAGVNPSKYTVSVGGRIINDLDDEVCDGDVITLQTNKFSSGR